MSKPNKPPVSYSYPWFRAGDYGNLDAQLIKLKQYGFRWITFTPTFAVVERQYSVTKFSSILSKQPIQTILNFGFWLASSNAHYYTIENHATVLAELSVAVGKAVREGFNVKVEPHLDFSSTMTSFKEDRWRIKMLFDPSNAELMRPGYQKTIIENIISIIEAADKTVAAPAPPPCYILTLGSELDVSLYNYPAGWKSLLAFAKKERIRIGMAMPQRLSFGHKLNYDCFQLEGAIRREINGVRAGFDLADLSAAEIDKQEESVLEYLRTLDFASFSFYPPVTPKLPNGKDIDWNNENDPDTIEAVAKEFKRAAKGLSDRVGPTVPIDIGEFGLGSSDTSQPHNDLPEEFTQVNPATGKLEKKSDVHAKRRLYIKGAAKFLRDQKPAFENKTGGRCGDYFPATFWTAKQYDFLGLWDYEVVLPTGDGNPNIVIPHDLFVDPELQEYITLCNRNTYGS